MSDVVDKKFVFAISSRVPHPKASLFRLKFLASFCHAGALVGDVRAGATATRHGAFLPLTTKPNPYISFREQT